MTTDVDRLATALKEIKLDWISERRQEFHAADLIDGFLAYLHGKLAECGVGFVYGMIPKADSEAAAQTALELGEQNASARLREAVAAMKLPLGVSVPYTVGFYDAQRLFLAALDGEREGHDEMDSDVPALRPDQSVDSGTGPDNRAVSEPGDHPMDSAGHPGNPLPAGGQQGDCVPPEPSSGPPTDVDVQADVRGAALFGTHIREVIDEFRAKAEGPDSEREGTSEGQYGAGKESAPARKCQSRDPHGIRNASDDPDVAPAAGDAIRKYDSLPEALSDERIEEIAQLASDAAAMQSRPTQARQAYAEVWRRELNEDAPAPAATGDDEQAARDRRQRLRTLAFDTWNEAYDMAYAAGLRRARPAVSEALLCIGDSEEFAREIHAAWRDGMQAQGREVPVERLQWETLLDADQQLDFYLAARLVRWLTAALAAQEE